MDKEKHSDHFGEGLFIGILIGHYVKPYDAPLWMRIVFWLLIISCIIYSLRGSIGKNKKSD